MAFTLSTLTEMRGYYWMQEPRLATIDLLGEKLHNALLLYHSTQRRLPDDIVVFRSGLSEGEFKDVSAKSLGKIIIFNSWIEKLIFITQNWGFEISIEKS